MDTAMTLPPAFRAAAIVAATVALLLAAIVPTALFFFVEPRGRRQWAIEGDDPSRRRAPAIVRITAWLSFALGQLAIPWILVPAACGVLLYLQAKLGHFRPVGLAATAAVGLGALAQVGITLGLWPLGIKLLMRDARICATLARRSRLMSLVSASLLAGGGLLGWAMTTIPHFVHPWLRAALMGTALRPVMAYAVVCLVHAALLGACCRSMGSGSASVGSKE